MIWNSPHRRRPQGRAIGDPGRPSGESEGADGPDAALDAAIAIALVPDVIIGLQEDDGTINPYTYWEYTASIDAVLELLKRCSNGRSWVLKSLPSGLYMAAVTGTPQTTARTPALALLAALLAVLIVLRSKKMQSRSLPEGD
jgi:hypothetical protein